MSFAIVTMQGVYLCQKKDDENGTIFTTNTITSNDGKELTYVNFKIAQSIRSYNKDGASSIRYNYWRVEATEGAATKVLKMNLKPGSRLDILCATPDIYKFTIDDVNYSQPVLKIKNASDIRFSDTYYKEDEKETKKEKPISNNEDVKNIDIENSPLFSDFAKQIAKGSQSSEPKPEPANSTPEKRDISSGFSNIPSNETPVFPCNFKPFFS